MWVSPRAAQDSLVRMERGSCNRRPAVLEEAGVRLQGGERFPVEVEDLDRIGRCPTAMVSPIHSQHPMPEARAENYTAKTGRCLWTLAVTRVSRVTRNIWNHYHPAIHNAQRSTEGYAARHCIQANIVVLGYPA